MTSINWCQMCETLPQISLTVLSPGRSKIKGLRFRQVNVRKSTRFEQTLFCQFNLIFETAANWGWVGELKYLRPWNTIDRTANMNTLGIYWTVRESYKMHTTECSYHFWTLLFGVPSLVGYIYSFTHIRIKREQTMSGKMRFVAQRAMKKTVLPEKLWNLHEIPKNKW